MTVGGNTVTGTYELGAGTDVIVASNGANLDGVNSGVATTAETLDISALAAIGVTMTKAQHDGFTTFSVNSTDDSITISTANATLTTNSSILNYTVDAGSSVTVGTGAGHLAQVITETGTEAVSTFTLGGGTYTGDWSGIDAADVVKVVNNTNIAGNTGLDSGATIDFQNGTGVGITLNATQNGVVTYASTTNSQTITLSAADTFTANAGIEKYVLTGASNITVNAATNVDGDTGNQTVTVGGNTVTGTYELGAGTDVINATTGADISGVNSGLATTAESLTLASDASISMTAAQYTGFSGTINAGGTAETIIFTDAISGITLNSAVENWTLAAGTNSAAIGAASQSVNANALTEAQTLTLTGSVAATVSLVAGDLTSGSYTGALTVTATTGTNEITTGSGNDLITGGDGVNTITTGGGTDTVNLLTPGSLGATANADTISDFTTTSDKLSFDGITVTGGGAIAATTGTAVAAGGVTAGALTDDTIYVIDNGGTALTSGGIQNIASYTDLADVAAYLGEGYNATADNDAAIFVINNGSGTAYVYLFDEQTAGADTITSTDLVLIGTVTEAGIGALVAGDIA